MSKYLHIISFDIPYPPNYGGAIDVFYKLKALQKNDVKIILHCFEYSRSKSPELEELCEKVFYYQRNTSIFLQFSLLPYTVYSRKKNELLSNLLLDNYPILFEGLMSCYYLENPQIRTRFKIYREANIEHEYYRELAKASKKLIKKAYLFIESKKLEFFETKLKYAELILAISKTDGDKLKAKFTKKRIEYIPGFHSNNEITSTVGKSDYVLYHANLSVAENEKAALYLCEKVFSTLNYKCVISGLRPSKQLVREISKHPNIELIPNPDQDTMNKLISNAQVNILITFQGTGLKLKLLNALFAGRFIVVNQTMLEGSGLESLCRIANSIEDQIRACNELMQIPFTQEEINVRQKFLIPQHSNQLQAKLLTEFI